MNFNNQWLLDDAFSTPTPPEKSNGWRRNTFGIMREIVQVVVLAIILYVVLNVFIPRYEVEGHSMEPNFHTAERVVVSRLNYVLGSPGRGDIIVFRHTSGKNLIKRVIGLPGETVLLDEGQVFINGIPLDEPYVSELCSAYSCRDKEWTLGLDEYFVLGDNRNHSMDSHNFGPINRSQIIGRVLMRYWPPDDLGLFFGGTD